MKLGNIFLVLLLVLMISPLIAIEIIEPKDIRRGDTGYGITVFQGTTPETFSFEVISVMKNFLPKHDLIIIKMEGDTLNFTGIIGGMSGSPVYINDKLAGAVAYGWVNSKEPLAGVAPIKNMLETFDFPTERTKPTSDKTTQKALPFSSEDNLQPLLNPLYVSGIPVDLLTKFNDKFNLSNFYPIQVGSAAASELMENDENYNNEIFPGGPIGVTLMQGDVNLSAIGTVTHVDTQQNKVLAFGHSFFNAGYVNFPITTAYIHTVVSRRDRSFKLGSALDIVGRLYSDNISCVSGLLDTYPELINMSVSINDGITESSSTFNYQLVDDRYWTPYLVLVGHISALNTYYRTEFVNVYYKTEVEFRNGDTVVFDNFLAVDSIIEYYNMIIPFLFIYNSRFEVPEVKNINTSITIKPNHNRYFIDNVLIPKNEYYTDENVYLTLRLKKDYSDEFVYKNIDFQIPENIDPGIYQILIEGGSSIVIRDVVRVENHREIINFLQSLPKNNKIRASLMLNRPKIFVKNQGLETLPVNVSNILASYNINFMPQFINFDFLTDKVMLGQRRVIIRVSNERF